MRRTLAAVLLLVATGCATTFVDRTRPMERGFPGSFGQEGKRVDRGDALRALEAYEPSREEVRSAGRYRGGAGAFMVGGLVLFTTALVPSDVPSRMKIAMAGTGFGMIYLVGLPFLITSEVRERSAVRRYNGQFVPAPASSGVRVIPLASAVPDAAGRPAPVGGVAISF